VSRLLKFAAIGALTCCAAIHAADETGWRVHSLENLDYPAIAASAQLAGTVELSLEIATDGSVAKVTRKSGNELLAQAAEENAKRWRFERQANGIKDSSEESHTLIYVFRLAGECKTQRCPTKFSFESPDRVLVETQPPHWQQ
jgi:TonB family protein